MIVDSMGCDVGGANTHGNHERIQIIQAITGSGCETISFPPKNLMHPQGIIPITKYLQQCTTYAQVKSAVLMHALLETESNALLTNIKTR